MISKRFGKNVFDQLIFGAYFVIALTLAVNKITLSLACMLLPLILVLEGDFKRYYQAISTSKIGVLVLVFFTWTLLSFAWSNDLAWAWKDIIVKLPLYLLPLVFIIEPIKDKKRMLLLLGAFLVAVTITSIINFTYYFSNWSTLQTTDTRSMSLFLSHIRFGLMINCATAIAYFWFRSKLTKYAWIGLLFVGWFCIYTYFSQVLTGFITLCVLVAFITLYELFQLKNRRIVNAVFIFGTVIVGIFAYQTVHFLTHRETMPELSTLPTHTAQGNLYHHDIRNQYTENGNFIFLYLNEQELSATWNQRSTHAYAGNDQKGQALRFTLMRYLTSKNLPKDAEGVKALSTQDIRNIEAGIPSILYFKKGLSGRMYEIRNELMFNNDPNGHSIGQRLHYWNAGWTIFKQHPLIGIGNGDIVQAFDTYYSTTDSPLTTENRLRTHNQFLTFAITLGIVGLGIFCALIVYYFQATVRNQLYLGSCIMLILLISFFVEDTLETQMGVTLFGFFFGLFGTTKVKI